MVTYLWQNSSELGVLVWNYTEWPGNLCKQEDWKFPNHFFLNVANIKSIRYTMILSYITSVSIIENHKSPITMVLTLSLSLHMPLPMTYCHWYQWPSLWQWFSRWRKKCPPFLQRTIKEVVGHIKAPWVTLRDFPPPRGICSSILNV